ncbi:hypothetical protein FACS189434_07920 [Bacteroidia bacterium]|nr:hypothetical protein FACS189434_07920 [Bacteroidia bacterium]
MEITEVTLLNGIMPVIGSVAGGSKIIIRGSGFMSLLGGFSEIDHIEFNGSQWLDTGIDQLGNERIELDFQANYTSGNTFIFGSRLSTDSGNNFSIYSRIFIIHHSLRFTYDLGGVNGSSSSTSLASVDNVRRQAIFDNASINFGGVITNTGKTAPTINPFNMYLGTINNGGTPRAEGFTGNIYSFQISKSGNLVMDLTPVVDNATGDVGFLDLITNTFYKQNASGVFTKISITKYVEIGDKICNILEISDTEIICETPSNAKGSFPVTVNNGTDSAMLENAFEYVPCLAQKTANGYNPLKMKYPGGDWEILLKQ